MNGFIKNFADIFTFSRASGGGRINALGAFEWVAANQPRIDHNPINLAAGTGPQTISLPKDRVFAVTIIGGGTVAITGAGVDLKYMGPSSGTIRTLPGTGNADITFTPSGTVTAVHIREVRGPLIEEQRTNLIQNSENIAAASWAKGANLTSNGVSGTLLGIPAYSFTSIGAGNSYVKAAPAVVVGQQYTATYLTDYGAAATRYVRCEGPGTIFLFTLTPVGGGVYLATCTFTVPAGTTAASVHLGPVDSVAGTSFRVTAAQLEAGAFATSYIPTAGSQVTRAADVCLINTLSPWFKTTEGCFVFEGEFGKGRWQVTGKTSYLDILGTDNIGINGFVRNASGNIIVTSGQLPSTAKLAVSWGAAGSKVCVNGGTVQTGAGVPDFSSGTVVSIGRGFDAASYLNGHVRRLRFFQKQPSDASHQSSTA